MGEAQRSILNKEVKRVNLGDADPCRVTATLRSPGRRMDFAMDS